MNAELIKAIVILPGTALVYVPGALLWIAAGTSADMVPAEITGTRLWIGLVAVVIGLAIAVWTVRLFLTVGKGTPAPWAPPRRLVVRGPYRYVRNPMITGVLFMLAGESIILGSWPVAGWMLGFFLLNSLYFVLVEEPGLERRLGEDYRHYKANVPRWIPRMTPWELGQEE
ncbi:MAG: isoprenylcysteine carboxylmethyltransferase family protein [bacterium]|nr:isoprenylcysteine carboxylmethyltransferase family protein [bacterium]